MTFRDSESAAREHIAALERDLRDRDRTIAALETAARRRAEDADPLRYRVAQLEETVHVTARRHGAAHEKDRLAIRRLERELETARAREAELRATLDATLRSSTPARTPSEESLRIEIRRLETAYREAKKDAERRPAAPHVPLPTPAEALAIAIVGGSAFAVVVAAMLAALH